MFWQVFFFATEAVNKLKQNRIYLINAVGSSVDSTPREELEILVSLIQK